MARLFTRASSDYLENANAVLTGVPISIACWFYSDDAAVDQSLVSIAASGGTDYFALEASGAVASDPVRAITSGSGTGVAVTSTGYSANTWHHACGVFAATNDRRVFIDGGSKGTNTTTRTPAGLDRTAMGRRAINVPVNYMSGRIAEVAVWSVALNDAEVAALAKGIPPFRLQTASLVGYWPLWGIHSPEIDLTVNNRQMTVTGAVLANHAPVTPFLLNRVTQVAAEEQRRSRRLLLGVGG